MANEIVRQDVQGLVDGWMEAERNGVAFPVPFDAAWVMAGYSNKANAKQSGLKGLKVEKHFSSQIMKNGQRGRSSELIFLSVDAFKHVCLMACTSEGEVIREYFIDAEKKWKLLQQLQPAIAQEIELIHAKQELARLETASAQASLQLIQFRHIVTTTMPEPTQQKILGYEVVEKTEYRDRIIHNDDLINDGSTVLKTDLCHRYSILTRNGKPDYKRLNQVLDQLPKDAFTMSVRIQDNYELRRDYLPELDKIVDSTDRNRWIGE